MAPKEKKEVSVNALPISFKDFAKEPVKGVMFLCLVAVGYLYVDGKMSYNSQIKKQGEKIEVLESKVDVLTNQLRRSDSALSAAISKINTLQELGKIK
jgi:outer membrane murein-binding lipoprotein Lpp